MQKNILLTLLLALILPSVAFGQGRRRAVVVGVASFEHGYASLDYTARDARRTASALEDLGYSVSLLAADADAGDVKYADVLSALKKTAERSQPGDTLLFFFAGHGSRRMGRDYLLLSDSDPDKFATTALALDTLSEIVAASKATRRVFVVDACRSTSRADGKTGFDSGKLDKGFKDKLDQLTQIAAPNNDIQTAVLYACSPGETSKENLEERAGLFTNRFVHALQQTDNTMPITIGGILGYVKSHMPATVEQTPLLVGPDTLQIGPSGQRTAPDVERPLLPNSVAVADRPHIKINPKDGAVMIFIPAGEFIMGDDDNEITDLTTGARNSPRHKVALSGYSIYRDLVTVGMYKKFCKATGKQMPPDPVYDNSNFNPNWSKEDHPIVNVAWEDAMAYCVWAGVSLPTEAQWEKAARGTDGRKYPWGNTFDPSKLWSSRSRRGDAGGTHRVGEFGISPYGCTDMAGNVWQWCLDKYDASFWSNSRSAVRDPVNIDTGQLYEARGGSWATYDERTPRCSFRGSAFPAMGYLVMGFRGAARAQ